MGSILRAYMWILLACLALSFVCVAYPMFVIRPFRAQGPNELAAALELIRIRPVLTVLSALAALAALSLYWRVQPRRWPRVAAAASAALVCVLAVLARINVYELMFHPIDHPAFAAAPEVKLDKDEKVIAVKMGGSARAYPIRSMSYHHVINDVLNNQAIVATY